MRFDGVLFFPVTAFDRAGRVDTAVLKDHVQSRLGHSPGGLFPACGTGEFHTLSVAEVSAVVSTTVQATGGAAPVLSGAGGPLGHALECARAAADAGADGLLVLPPYLVNAPVDGLVAYVEAIAAATDLPLVVYHRANAKFTASAMSRLARDPQVIGFKDGVGDIGETQRIVLAVRATGRTDFQFFNGLLTAELTQAAFRGIGVPLYSSAVFAMAPEIATAFYRAYMDGNEERRTDLLTGFYEPLVALRDRVPGYAVSLIKAGVRQSGLDVGSVRPPLVDPTPADLATLAEILAHGHRLASA
ncbi:5-dehydro-4-deoxyglucarate dehydratase [Microlunatus panaciterrae]|uniref:Probable 5-dehydro-4-deoxyglucarate dehydratase n=1 Tax=Microlunatus panaciterrae TaxID=400768 RepID=A0ABS2RHG4_9ACTN|nr:5-dehydro-4-deoxyglucarate dehydratase [Microlunatus panaciterrae]MBM7798440.1 5-dehydro-4-deoxyglucarate dehydratase [Microlunatus panaciterrae]